jgi:hypothetical protein
MWSVGDQAVCVNKRPIPPAVIQNCNLLDEGAIYTVTGATKSEYYPGMTLLFLAEIPGIGFHEWRFRKVVKMKGEIGLLKELIKKPKNPDPVREKEKKIKEPEKVDEKEFEYIER